MNQINGVSCLHIRQSILAKVLDHRCLLQNYLKIIKVDVYKVVETETLIFNLDSVTFISDIIR